MSVTLWPRLGDRDETVEVVHRKVALRLILANATGAAAVFSYLQLEADVTSINSEDYSLRAQVLLLAAQLVVMCPFLIWWAHSRFRSTTTWLREKRAITPAERSALLREPFNQAMRPLAGWLIAAATWGVVIALTGGAARETLRIVNGIVIGGVTVCTLSYLQIESAFRPLFALALEGAPPQRPSTLGVRLRLMLAWAAGSGVPLLGLAISPLQGTDADDSAAVVLAVLGLIAGSIAVLITAHSLAQPLDEVRDALARVRDGDLDVALAVDDGGEVGEVQAGFNRMVQGLRERERLQDLFGRHVGEEVARQALEEGTQLGGEQHEASVVFVDLIGSTAMAEVLPPSEVVATLNDFFDAVVRAVTAEGGWVNKFEGDGALCVFGVPSIQPDHAARALRSARRLLAEMSRLRERHPGLEAGIGVASGTVVAGNVGTEARYEYTVIGPAVNVAARLTDVAKGRTVKALASASAIERAGAEAASWRDVGTVGIRGHAKPTVIHEPRSPLPAEDPVHGLGHGQAVS